MTDQHAGADEVIKGLREERRRLLDECQALRDRMAKLELVADAAEARYAASVPQDERLRRALSKLREKP